MVTVPLPTLFSASVEKAGPKHSTSVPFSARVAIPVSVDVNEVAPVPGPNPVLGVAVNSLLGPHRTLPVTICERGHSKVPLTFQMVTPFLFPSTVHLKVKGSPGQVGEAVINCPLTPPGYVDRNTVSLIHCQQNCYFRQEFCGYYYICVAIIQRKDAVGVFLSAH